METRDLKVGKAGRQRLLKGHPWIFRDDMTELPKEGAGAVCVLRDEEGRYLARGFYNPASRIAFRLITREDEPVDAPFWERRLEAALDYRASLKIESTARRIISSEADGFPGLIVDDYGGCLSIQIQTLGMEVLKPLLADLLRQRLSPTAMVLRNDAPVRTLEGLPQERTLLAGSLPDPVEVREGDLTFRVDLITGQKTGAYLDQRDNRIRLRSFARGRRALDAFCYDGWFALHLARGGGRDVVALDSSAEALSRLESNMERNGLTGVEPRRGNCFDVLKAFHDEGERFDLIVLDPPPFARRKMDVGAALRAYREINLRALRCLNPGGLLFTCCCSHGVSQDAFSGAVAEAAARARQRLLLLEQRIQPPDHPVLFNAPESLYLKGLLFRNHGPG